MATFRELAIVNCVRGSGPGGQNVNKVNSKVEVRLPLALLEQPIANRLQERSKRVTNEGILIITCQESRDQAKNKEKAFQKLEEHIALMMEDPKDRLYSGVTYEAKQKRLNAKKVHSEHKSNRRAKDWED